MEHVQDKDVQIFMRALGLAVAEPAPMGWAAMPAPQGAVAGQITADQALANIAEQYRNLQMQAGRILTLFGSNAPCEVINRHYEAVNSYMTAASDVFQQLTKQGFTVVQQLYNLQGEKTGEQKGPEPVKPAYFEPCKSAGMGGAIGFKSASFRDSTATGRMVLNLGATTDNGLGVLPVIAWIVIALIAGGTVVAVTHTIVVNNPALPIKQVEAQGQWMDNYLGCVERSMKNQGLDHAKADAACRGLTAPPEPPKPLDINQLLMWGLVGVGIVGGAALLAYLVRRDRTQATALLPAHHPEHDEAEYAPEAAAAELWLPPGFVPPPVSFALPPVSYAPPPVPYAYEPEIETDETLADAGQPAYVRWCPCR